MFSCSAKCKASTSAKNPEFSTSIPIRFDSNGSILTPLGYIQGWVETVRSKMYKDTIRCAYCGEPVQMGK